MNIKKLRPDAIVPTKAYKTDAGFDLYVYETVRIVNYLDEATQEPTKIHTGIAIEFPIGKFGLIKERSSLAIQGMKILGGVIDYGYTGEIIVVAYNFGDTVMAFNRGDRIAQLLVLPFFDALVMEVEELSITERRDKGFGSSNNNSIDKEIEK